MGFPSTLCVRISLDDGAERIRYTLPRHKRGQWIGAGRNKKATSPDAQGVINLTPHDFLSRLADLVPPPRKHRHRYHRVFAPNHPLRAAVTALAIGNAGKPTGTATDAEGQPAKRTDAPDGETGSLHHWYRSQPARWR